MDSNAYYYRIVLAYEVPFNVLDTEGDENKIIARDSLYKKLSELVDPEKYEKFSTKLIIYQLKDTYNYMITYEAFFRCTHGLPMEEYVEAEGIKKAAQKELESFFGAQDCECKQISIKTLL